MSVKKITGIAFLAALLYVSKVVLEFLPNVELVSLLIILYTLVFGKETLLAVVVFNLFEVVQWGIGTWTISYLYTWPLLCVLTLVFKRWFREEFIFWAIFSGCFGLIFGALFAIVYLPVGWSAALSYWILGLPWDVWHAAANFVLMLILGKPVYGVLCKVKNQIE